MAKENIDITTGQQGQHAVPHNAASASQIVLNEQAETSTITDNCPVSHVPASWEDTGDRSGPADIVSLAPKEQSSATAARTGSTESTSAPITTNALDFDPRRPWIRRHATLQQNGCVTPTTLYGQTGMTTYQGQEMVDEPFQNLRGHGPGQNTLGNAGINGSGHYDKGDTGTGDSSSSTGATGHRTT